MALSLTARLAGAAIATLALVTSISTADAAPLPSKDSTPLTIPALTDWEPAAGSFTWSKTSRIITDRTSTQVAHRLADDLQDRLGRKVPVSSGKARTGDVVLSVDKRAALGDEGYTMDVGRTVEIEAATETGTFYGTRTLVQLLTRSKTIPGGSTTDVPAYPERGVGVCACQIQVSTEWFERLMKDMSYLKLNQLWIETKVRSDAYPEANFWAYYTKAEARQLQKWADENHIQLVLEVNSPGHMSPWLANYPELQLTNSAGVKQPDRLDITQPEALEFVTTLADEYAKVFDDTYWHMGADEYMLGSAFEQYPQFQEYMDAHPEQYGPDAVPEDVYVDFINAVAGHLRERGRTLRVWNDGIPLNATHQLDQDIVVEYWDGRASMVQAQEIIERGYDLQNASYSLYLIRNGGSNPINEESLWNQGWTPRKFDGTDPTPIPDNPNGGQVRGAKITAWPDYSTTQTENSVEQDLFAATRFIAESTWATEHTVGNYAEFAALSDELGRSPRYENVDFQPLKDGKATVKLGKNWIGADGNQLKAVAKKQTFDLKATDDGYYRITTQNSSCLRMQGGRLWLGSPLDDKLPVSVVGDCKADNLEKWQIKPVKGGYQLINAITQMPITTADGVLVQRPADRKAPAVFTFGRG
ncbi:beta-N-acetylhexosaminidase [Kineosporia babensis]|uniref:Beta-N-acetylhexosaminidase n=1 Tax=Kineosporia babensis TaxID=499548 RepID=A0A9X1NE46_9ACTN|nr:beta-N-acetylhexosaminidase [Kineosporia babensis]MCD5312076.1 beta-N-acetylhexosaminidase [Kineosporia babensis]